MSSILELRHLRTFLALRQSDSLSQAANQLCLTQSALSHQLKLLEEYYGVSLLERRLSPMRLTPAGECLADLAAQTLGEVAEAERKLAVLAQGHAGPLRIAIECNTCFEWLIPVMDAFRADWPQVDLDIVSGFHTDPAALVLSGRADLALTGEVENEPQLVYTPMFRYEMLGVMGNQHPLTAKKHLAAEDFAQHTLITYPIDDAYLDIMKLLKPAGVVPSKRTSELTIVILQLVASGHGIAVLPEWSVQSHRDSGYIQTRRIADGLMSNLYAVNTQALSTQPYMLAFLELLKQSCFQRLSGIQNIV